MKNKIKLLCLFLIGVNLPVFSQLLFEVNEPIVLEGVYPAIEPTIGWSSPNLNQVGNWFSDTLVLVENEDACSTLTQDYSGKFV